MAQPGSLDDWGYRLPEYMMLRKIILYPRRFVPINEPSVSGEIPG